MTFFLQAGKKILMFSWRAQKHLQVDNFAPGGQNALAFGSSYRIFDSADSILGRKWPSLRPIGTQYTIVLTLAFPFLFAYTC